MNFDWATEKNWKLEIHLDPSTFFMYVGSEEIENATAVWRNKQEKNYYNTSLNFFFSFDSILSILDFLSGSDLTCVRYEKETFQTFLLLYLGNCEAEEKKNLRRKMNFESNVIKPHPLLFRLRFERERTKKNEEISLKMEHRTDKEDVPIEWMKCIKCNFNRCSSLLGKSFFFSSRKANEWILHQPNNKGNLNVFFFLFIILLYLGKWTEIKRVQYNWLPCH